MYSQTSNRVTASCYTSLISFIFFFSLCLFSCWKPFVQRLLTVQEAQIVASRCLHSKGDGVWSQIHTAPCVSVSVSASPSAALFSASSLCSTARRSLVQPRFPGSRSAALANVLRMTLLHHDALCLRAASFTLPLVKHTHTHTRVLPSC